MTSSQPSDTARRRNIRACNYCRSAKRRCSSDLPCLQCIKRKRATACTYDRVIPPENHTPSREALQPQHYPSEQTATEQPQQAGSAADHAAVRSPFALDSPDGRSSEETTMLTRPRFLRNSRGHDVYVGNTAVIAFLPLLRDIFRHHTGPSKFTEFTNKNTMLESPAQSEATVPVRDHTDFAQKSELVQLCFAATSGILDLFDASEVLESLEGIELGRHLGSGQYVCANLVVAIGARCHADGQSYAACEQIHLANARHKLSLDLVEDADLDTVRISLLLAFYMLCACRRNTAYMYLGVAARAAHTIGLHHQELFASVNNERQLRVKTWKSLRVLDTLVSLFLGRPSATSRHASESVLPAETPTETAVPRSLSLDATYRLLTPLDTIINDMYRRRDTCAASAKVLLQRLTDWSTSLHPALRSTSTGDSFDTLDQELVLGNMHVSCAYYFAVILITRPYLMHHLLSDAAASKKNTRRSQNASSRNPATTDPETAELSKTCEDAAVLMLDSCRDILQAGIMLSNMCLLQAWTFAAALILGIIMFIKPDPSVGLMRSFENARAVLRHLATRSQQSEHYLEILSDLLHDVERRQQQSAQRSRESSGQLVGRIFRLNHVTDDVSTVTGLGDSRTIDVDSSVTQDQAHTSSQLSDPASPWLSLYGPEAFLDWDSLAFQSWDDFL